LDDDLMIAFNKAGGHTESQLLILQLQTTRQLSKVIKLLEGTQFSKPIVGVVEETQGEPDEDA